jgi:hypothetical protein
MVTEVPSWSLSKLDRATFSDSHTLHSRHVAVCALFGELADRYSIVTDNEHESLSAISLNCSAWDQNDSFQGVHQQTSVDELIRK